MLPPVLSTEVHRQLLGVSSATAHSGCCSLGYWADDNYADTFVQDAYASTTMQDAMKADLIKKGIGTADEVLCNRVPLAGEEEE